MTSGLLQDPTASPQAESSTSSPRFRPFASPEHHVTKSRYITSNDPRGYIPVYEYPLNGQWIMMDVDDGYVLWTGIWKALGNSKADIVKMIESQPDLASQIRRVRGGYLKIQGTWMPYEVALRLSRRVAWPIRHDLVPLFGPTFPSTCLSPEQPGYGQVIPNGTGRRRSRRAHQTANSAFLASGASAPQAGWTIISSGPSRPHEIGQSVTQFASPPPSSFPPPSWSTGLNYIHHRPPPPPRLSVSAPTDTLSIDGGVDRLSLNRERSQPGRYSPYPGPSPSLSFSGSYASTKSSPVGNPRLPFPALFGTSEAHRTPPGEEQIILPPIQPPNETRASNSASISLPPISSWADSHDSKVVLQRLQTADTAGDLRSPIDEELIRRRRSTSVSSSKIHADVSRSQWPLRPARDETSQRTSASFGGRSSPRTSTSSYRQQAGFDSGFPSPSASFSSSTNGGISPMDPSPIMPPTPRSVAGPASPRDGVAGLSTRPVPAMLHERAGDVLTTPQQSATGYDRAWSPQPVYIHHEKHLSSYRGESLHCSQNSIGLPSISGGTGQTSTHPIRPW